MAKASVVPEPPDVAKLAATVADLVKRVEALEQQIGPVDEVDRLRSEVALLKRRMVSQRLGAL